MSTSAVPLIASIGHSGIEGEYFVATDLSQVRIGSIANLRESSILQSTYAATQYERIGFSDKVGFGKQLIAKIPRIGELLGGVWLVLDLPGFDKTHRRAQEAAANLGKNFAGPFFEWCQNIEHAIIDNVELWIGGVFIER
jgi:hypothetical protein